MVWIFDTLNANPWLPLLGLLTTTTEKRAMDWAVFIPSEFHRGLLYKLVWVGVLGRYEKGGFT